jgi:hypothetical protein
MKLITNISTRYNKKIKNNNLKITYISINIQIKYKLY